MVQLSPHAPKTATDNAQNECGYASMTLFMGSKKSTFIKKLSYVPEHSLLNFLTNIPAHKP